jgi:hypothetical protein
MKPLFVVVFDCPPEVVKIALVEEPDVAILSVEEEISKDLFPPSLYFINSVAKFVI